MSTAHLQQMQMSAIPELFLMLAAIRLGKSSNNVVDSYLATFTDALNLSCINWTLAVKPFQCGSCINWHLVIIVTADVLVPNGARQSADSDDHKVRHVSPHVLGFHMIWYDMIWYDVWYDMTIMFIWYMIWYDWIWYDMIGYGMIMR